ncbi:MAG: ABC transporter permease [Acidobacteriota bacterium]
MPTSLAVARRLVHHRGLLVTLTRRELKARYRGSLLGFFWSLVNPLMLTAVYSLVFGLILGPRAGEGPQPYALYLITGLFPWLWASSALLEGTVALSANAGLVRKAVFPVDLPPVVAVLANLVHFLLALPVLLAALAIGRVMGFDLGGWSLLLLPVVILLQMPMLMGLSLGLAALNLLFKDVKDLLNNLLTLLFFMAPIIYPLDLIGHWLLRGVIMANPFTHFTLAYQRVLFEGGLPSSGAWLLLAALSLGCWWLGAGLFGRLRETLVEMA